MTNPNIVRLLRQNYTLHKDGSFQRRLAELHLSAPALVTRGYWDIYEFDTGLDASKFKELLQDYRNPNAPPDSMYENLLA